MSRGRAAAALMAGMLFLGAQAAGAADIPTHPETTVTGAGATFPLNVIEQWKADFKKDKNVTIAYTGVGSGAGRAQLIAGTVDFAGSDTLAKPEEVTQLKDKYGDFVYMPETAGAVAIFFKVPGLSELKLSAPTIAKIFAGTVKNWNDPAIAADNVTGGPDLPIQVFVRSDKSGTSGVFTQYLSKAAPAEWTTGSNETFPITETGKQIGKAGSDGVANAVAAATGGIGYAEHSFAVERGLGEVKVKNGAGQFKGPDTANVTEAIDDATINADGSLALAFTGQNPSAYPVSTVSYIMAPVKMDEKKADNLKAWLTYVLGDGQSKAAPLGYAPLPAKVRTAALEQMAKINPPVAALAAPPAPVPAPEPTPTTAPAPKPVAVKPAPAPKPVAAAPATSEPDAALASTGSSKTIPLAIAGSLLAVGGFMIHNGRRKMAALLGD